ncbi:RNA polymerase sigma factor [Rhodothermus marinus]|uniref:RNA polymerase sigma factor n=1 Tax=Rhodothermus marinus TaxID=29549 RepID=UPI0012BA4A36|nr:sigma-70 family RNA polymerase sigma factor [Rhodothermus marinus]BBM70960.1 RNA polymerase sigma24 factor [Rhodothermus marinus]BBM73939.1 RNA polymerase sigma24 factor [Rhodothermus marinus]
MNIQQKERVVLRREALQRLPSEENKARYEELQRLSDEDLMSLFQAGTVEAFDILVSRYQDPLANYLYRFLGDPKEVEDLLQETFMRVYRNRHSYRRIAKFSTWLYTIAGNLARSEYRKRKRRRVYSLQSVNRDEEEYEVEIPDETFAPDRHTESTIQDRYIQEALKQIPEEFREVVVLRDVQQLSYEEIAEITGLPMGTVKSRINRGRTKLQALLKDVYPMPEES